MNYIDGDFIPFKALENPSEAYEGYIDLMDTQPEGSDVLDNLIQLELVKNIMKDKKKNKDEGQTFLNSYLA